MKKFLTTFLVLAGAALLWLLLDLSNKPATEPPTLRSSNRPVGWDWLSLALPGEFLVHDGIVTWRGALPGQQIDAGTATLQATPPSGGVSEVRARFASRELLGRLTLQVPPDALSSDHPRFQALQLRSNLEPPRPLALTPWLSLVGKIGLNIDAEHSEGTSLTASIKLTGNDPQFLAAIPRSSEQVGAAAFDSLGVQVTLNGNNAEITEFVATGKGIRVSGKGSMSFGDDYESSKIELTLEVARSQATTQPELSSAYAGLAQSSNYQISLRGPLHAPQVLINGFPFDPAAGPVIVTESASTSPSASATRQRRRSRVKEPAPHTTRGGAHGHARGRAPLPWPDDSPQALRFQELWSSFQAEFNTLAEEGQTVRGLTRKQLKRQVINQVREEFGEPIEE